MSGPGKSHREGITLAALFRRFPDDETAERYLIETRWPDGPHCPHCGSTSVQSGAKHPTMPFRCRERECRKRFSVKTGTVMEASNIGYQNWVIAMYLFSTSLKSVSSMKLHRDLGITQKSAWFMAHRLRDAYKSNEGLFAGPAEADETYIGGLRKNMSNAKRKVLAGTGRGAVGKAIVVGIKDRATNKVSAAVVEGTDAWTLQSFIEDHLGDDAQVFTDEHGSYVGVVADHASVNHSAGEYVREEDGALVHTNGIESFWSMLKRAYKGTFHKISPKHLDRYVTEFTGRHNVRELDTMDQMGELLAGMRGRRLTYPALISDNGRASGSRPTALRP